MSTVFFLPFIWTAYARTMSRLWLFAALALFAGTAAAQGQSPRFVYGSQTLTALVSESYGVVGANTPAFYPWFEAEYAAKPAAHLAGFPTLSLREALDRRGAQIAALKNRAERTRLELNTAAWLHKLVKVLIPRFSLERGYEFAYTVRNGERQCLLQSTLISGMLQRMGVEAGIVMVWKNASGKVSNLGHMVSVVRLADGRDVLTDASEPTPFYPHPGLFTPVNGAYRFVEARFNADNTISTYRPLGRGEVGSTALRLLPWNYIRSQYFYYRGERYPGGFINGPKTTAGRAASARFLEQAVALAPENPLATYVLGLVYERQGKAADGARLIRRAYALYQAAGFVPDGPLAAYRGLAAAAR
jgi:hypothetical protein